MLYLKIETAWAFVLQSWGYLQLAILISHCCRSSGYNFKSIGQAKVRDILKKCRVNSSYCQGKKVHLYWGCGKVIIEKSRCGRCLWNRNWDLGWIWADWQYWKKGSGPIMSIFWGWFFHVFKGTKNQVVSALKSCIKWT